MFDKLVKLALTHALDTRCNALNRCPARDEPVIALLALAVLNILNLLHNALILVLRLSNLTRNICTLL